MDACLDAGLNLNPTLRSVKLELKLDRPAKLAAMSQFLPQITVGYDLDQVAYYNQTYLNPDGRVVVLPITQPDGDVIPVQSGRRRNSQYFFRMEEILFDGGRNLLNLKTAGIAERRRRNEVSLFESNLRAEITTAYCTAFAAQERRRLAEEVLALRRIQLRNAEIRFSTGSVTRRDVLQAEVDLGRAVSDSITAYVEFKRLAESLNLLVGFPLDSASELQSLPEIPASDWNEQELIDLALQHRSDLKSQGETVQMLATERTIAQRYHLPMLTAEVLHTRTEQSGAGVPFTLNPRNRSTRAGLTLSWTLFDRYNRSLRVQESQVRESQAEIQLREMAREIAQRVTAALDNLNSIRQQVVVSRQNTAWAEETLRFEQERYRVGGANIIELGAAQVSYIQARNDQIELESRLVIALSELELACGVTLRAN